MLIRLLLGLLLFTLAALLFSCQSTHGVVKFQEEGIYKAPDRITIVDNREQTVDVIDEKLTSKEFHDLHQLYKKCEWRVHKRGNKLEFWITCK